MTSRYDKTHPTQPAQRQQCYTLTSTSSLYPPGEICVCSELPAHSGEYSQRLLSHPHQTQLWTVSLGLPH